jgi:hypothetical protein
MEISDVRRRIVETIDRAKRAAVERRARADRAGRDYERFLEDVAVPLFRQVHNVLRAHGYSFTVFTPGGGVRLMSDRSSEDFIELALDTSGSEPCVVGHTSRSRGRRVIETEHVVGSGDPAELSEEVVLAFLARELEPFVER